MILTSSANRGRLLIVAAAVFWSLSGVFAKAIDLGGAPLAFWRSLFGGLALLPFVPARHRAFRPAMLPLGLAFAATMGLYLGSVKATTAANAIFLQYTAIFWTIPLAALLLGEKPDRRSVLGIALAMVGVVLIVALGRDGRSGEGRGIALGLGSGLGYAAIIVGFRGLRDLDPTWLAASSNLAGAVLLGAWIGLDSGTIPRPEAHDWPKLVAFGVVQLAIPYVLFARGLRAVKAPEASLLTLIEPLLIPIWVFLGHGERPANATLAGGLFLLAGVATRYFPTSKAPTLPEIQLVTGADPARIEQARGLLRAYAAEFAPALLAQDFEGEVAGLPGRYAPPSGSILLAFVGDRAAGCVLMRDLGGGTAEMKRLYVLPEFRKSGIGRRLVLAILDRAREAGHDRMVLDSIPEMVEAIALYRSCGFADIPRYHPDTTVHAVFMGIELAPSPA